MIDGEDDRKVVACLGSSTTAGRGQAFNWIGELEQRQRNRAFRFRNFGVGGDFSYNMLSRLSGVVAARPDKIVIVIGANDILGLVFKRLRVVLGLVKRLPEMPSPESFRRNLETAAERLRRETSAKIAIASLPEIGEDPASTAPVQRELNLRFAEFSRIIEDVCRRGGFTYIPAYERLHAEIVASPGRAFAVFSFAAFFRDTFRFFVLRQSSDEIAATNGWRFHVDGIHLNRRGGMILADLVQEFLDY